ncbi:Peroxisomal acyl-coenzyme A oxidase 1 [Phytophthora cactorum]|uniref:Acyl-coenzyme A oxidase n=1 Tax=Phytophthora cactorum TaxID=29920 RepID=A0A329RRX3_9STRA|nr:Peroxisomal acyl-coenzyme A oxidase 1 [Phytophthora cactorum]KAG2841445.1 Peroxisomal acyl-coenzyme A oxidase 1 [Phytophthora cactorum]KAG2883014.1 Peroxisomal acyl-coenzyme A oxidase 1 [Phytophthora cactorum]KAG2902427.1 Peroxisomal acyl-coenzyme A oxidase 1 [Phytophthora cactorum]KAG2997150.1 Peroxisomal acyl-coenzyme A oxidase 1 [Phytophthora cactorum]
MAPVSSVPLHDLAPLLLRRERECSDIDVELLADALRGGREANRRRKLMVELVRRHPVLSRRDSIYQNHAQRCAAGLKKAFHYIKLVQDQRIEDPRDQQELYVALGERLPLEVHRAMFIPTLENQAGYEQQAKWLPLARDFKIIGAYAQTELGHGSNVQGLETTAVFDKETQTFVIDSPTLTSRKWWPGGLGKTATHAIVHAKLHINGDSKGVQAFIVPLRSPEDHTPLPGIEMGDIGPKVGFNSLDNGYAVFRNVRIPRRNMLMRYAKVLKDGTFIKPKSSKLVYLTMTQVRAYLILKLSFILGAATTITTRFSAVRVQGKKSTSDGDNFDLTKEYPVLDYHNQQHVLLPLISLAYAANFAGRAITALHDNTLDLMRRGHGSFAAHIAEVHAVSSGLKALLADRVNDGIEQCRRLCGGCGFLQSSNLAHLFAENVGACTFEGTFDVLVKQHARYLLKAYARLSHASEANGANEEETPTSFLRSTDLYTNRHLRCNAHRADDFGKFHVLTDAFEVRAARSIQRLAEAMGASGRDINSCMLLMATVSTHHAELMLLKSFISGVYSLPAGKTKVAVAQLCQLFGASLLVKGLGDFRQDDYFSSNQGEMVHQQLQKLLSPVRRNAVRLTDAWDFSDFELNSTIGRYDGDIYRALVEQTKREPLNASEMVDEYDKYLRPLIRSAL